MNERRSPLVAEGWSGPGRRDGIIKPLDPAEDSLHINPYKKGEYEWWYFDAHLDTGHTIVVFFHASNPNPGMAGKSGVEIVLLRPDGRKTQQFMPCDKKDFIASREKADIRIGESYLKSEHPKKGLPRYEIHVQAEGIACHLFYQAEVKGWKPGSGISRFGDLGYFAWIVPFARAAVEGTITDGMHTSKVTGIGYHDHNWLDFQFPRIIKYWMWGRIYSKHYTVSYAFIQCNDRMDKHAVKVLMVARGKEVMLSTGEFDFIKEEYKYNGSAQHSYPTKLTIRIPRRFEAKLNVSRVLEAENMLENFGPVLRFVAKYLLRLKPGYFRLASNFEIRVSQKGKAVREKGTTLHEIVLFAPAE